MNLLFHIPPDNLLNTYQKMKNILNGHDSIIFNTMKSLDSRFCIPINSSQYIQKHNEIESRLIRFTGVLRGREFAMRLLQGVWYEIQEKGGIQGVSNNDLLDALSFQTNKEGVYIKLTDPGYWAIEWDIPLKAAHYEDSQKVLLEHLTLTDSGEINEIVPKYVLEYIGSSFNCYKEGMNSVAVALISIAMEATLRDILAKRGYLFNSRASSVKEYPFTKADVEVVDNAYKFTFQETMPKIPALFNTSSGGHPKVEVQIKRKINSKRTDLLIKAPEFLLDHFSISNPTSEGVKKVNGLGEALRIARDEEQILTADVMPLDFDEVIRAIRNSLIHLSEASLSQKLNQKWELFPENFTLGDFLKDQEMVYDLITNIPRFINEQYLLMYRRSINVAVPS
ncbi:hypothetical protein [Bacillus sp. E214]|uniref:hypothetical protein n=1 Tax=Bacillus sp. E214 TaxID=2587156 RepID=UPI0011DF26E2|nr:hypothetical protein [Bacillus sp. E214]